MIVIVLHFRYYLVGLVVISAIAELGVLGSIPESGILSIRNGVYLGELMLNFKVDNCWSRFSNWWKLADSTVGTMFERLTAVPRSIAIVIVPDPARSLFFRCLYRKR